MKKRKKGGSLVETLVGLMVFGMVWIAGVTSLKYSSAVASGQDEMAIANAILTYVAEDILTEEFSSISVGSPSSLSTFYTSGAGKPNTLDELTNASIVVSVTEPDGADTGLKKVIITLNWTGTVGTTYPQILKLYVCDTST